MIGPATDTHRVVLRTALLLVAASALFLPMLESPPLERAEIYFLDAARAMVETGDYLVPRYRGEPFFDKPPLTYWLIAAAFNVGGPTLSVGRMVPAAAALGVLAVTAWLGRLLLDRRAALAGSVILATTLAFVSFGRLAMSDMLLALWSTLAMALAVAAWRPGAPPWLLPTIGAVLGLGFLTKGPIALLLPGLGLLLLAYRLWPERPPLTVTGVAAAAALFVSIGLGWFAALYFRLGWGPLEYFFLRENLQRFAGETYDSGRAPWYYLGTYLAEGIPWSLFFPIALLGLRRKEGSAGAAQTDGVRVLAIWLGLMAVPLSLSRGKLDYYLLPLYPAASLVVGRFFTAPSWSRFERGWVRVVLALVAGGLIVLVLLPTRIPSPWLPDPRIRGGLSILAVAAAGTLMAVAARTTPARALTALVATAGGLYVGLILFFLPVFRARQPNLLITRDVIRELRYRPDARLALCADPARVQRDVLFEARLAAEEHCDLWNPASSRLPFLLLVQQEERESLERNPRIRIVGEYRYLPATALTLAGLWRRYDADQLVLIANYRTDDPEAIARQKRKRKREMQERSKANGGS
jgi:4-amino-4-deoxy-L-arabinose transferase-like glycosyltransferase